MKESKFDLLTASIALVASVAIAYIVCAALLPEIQPVTFSTIDGKITGTVEKPSQDIFNITSINPTVEVCVGCVGDDDVEENIDVDESEEEENSSNIEAEEE